MTTAPYARSRPISAAGAVFVVALHLLAFWLLLRMQIVSLPSPPALLSVNLIQPAAVRPEPAAAPPRPKPVAMRPAPTPQPQPLALPADAPAPAPSIQMPAAPAPVVPAASPAAAPAPDAPTAPRFDADYLDNPKPVYPSLSRRMGEEGKVVLRVRVLHDGRADEIQIHGPSGSPRLDQAALEAVRRWRFVPARQGTETVAAWVLVPIVFTLKE